ncbi:hypothetical protein [Granulicella mallensis]|uniref:Uncharacterized protein n=1 Tax=Granulicella mallensis TaxID=940614 RepID=A0A7W7ZRX9_9BACT|nr:hypothetical protein [Granulicella mallensis]MBB5065001.1 hypothetical protein [Granulicella mallensis]
MSAPQDFKDVTRQTGPMNFTARASVVNRTHRVVREQALVMREQKQRSRSLWVPLGIFSMLLMGLCYAVWAVLEGYDELAPNGVPDASDQLFLLLLWSLPVTAVLLGLAWFQRDRGQSNSEVTR